MSLSVDKEVRELSDDELLERIAGLDPERYPIAKHAQRALDGQEVSR